MTPYTSGFNQSATYWAPNLPDGFGGFNFISPVVITCRWQDKLNMVRNAEGQEVVSMIVVYADRLLKHKGWLCLGDQSASGNPTADAQEIVQLGQSPSLDGTEVLYKVWL